MPDRRVRVTAAPGEDQGAIHDEIAPTDVEILGEVGDIGVGRMFTARDPDGNYIQVYHFYPEFLAMQQQG